jgi:hypothetical protein
MNRFLKSRLNKPNPTGALEGFAIQRRRTVPYEFVLDALSPISPWSRPMFGCLAVYVEDKIVLALRDKQEHPEDNGVWLATTQEQHESLHREFPNMRSIGLLGKRVTGWQVLPADSVDFEEAALRACELIVAGDLRIGKVPGTRRASSPRVAKPQKPSTRAKKTKSGVRMGSKR